MNAEDKQWFIRLVVDVVTEEPEIFGEVVMAMQHGLAQALSEERQHSSNLASGLSLFIAEDKHKRKFPYYHNIQNALHSLRRHYGGTKFWEGVEPLIEKEEED